MRYEITDIVPIGESRDVLLDLSFWHGNAQIGNRPADYSEHHLVISVPTPSPQPIRNELGQYERADGTFEPSVREVDGEWVPWVPEQGDPVYLWENEDDLFNNIILEVVEERAMLALAQNKRGQDKYPDDQKPKKVTKAGHMANKAAVKALIKTQRQL